MPKFARPNSYTGKQSNQQWTGDARSATVAEALAGASKQVYISPSTLAAAGTALVPSATTLVAGKVFLATNAEAVTGTVSTNKAIVPASLTARMQAPGPIGGTTPAAGTFTAITGTKNNYTALASGAAAAALAAGTVALIGGTIVVSTTAVTATSQIRLTCQALGTVTVPSGLCVSAKSTGVSFTILASQATDTSTIFWEVVN